MLVSAWFHSSVVQFSSQLWVYARHTCVAAPPNSMVKQCGGQCGLQNLPEKLGVYSSNLTVWSMQQSSNWCLSHPAESWQAVVHMAVVWVRLQRRCGISSKYRSAPRIQQAVEVLKLWGR